MLINKYLKLLLWIVLFQSIGFLMGMLTQANIYPWYEQLNKSDLTPPGFVFSIVWTFLYVLLAVIAWILWDKNQAPSKQGASLRANYVGGKRKHRAHAL